MPFCVVAHGAWSSAWAWKKMYPLLEPRGIHLVIPTLTGLGQRSHLAHPGIDLETHIADVLACLFYNDLRDVCLIGHSYGGMVATGVADRARDRIGKLIYVDAFVPRNGESAFDVMPESTRQQRQSAAAGGPDSWRIPPGPMPADTTPEDQVWCAPRRVPQPLKTFEQKLKFQNGDLTLPRHYIYCTRHTPEDRFRPFYERAKVEAGWQPYEIDASHNPHITAPQAFADLLSRIVA
ncbi:alpha/beta fold hydrolase [Undibacter mobilis]|uniref:Alpha/beta hydrolase n=1 Tax=Undibacter mobilis TaxID=2292256 RepID=A0A371B0L6_9BRAD|nr:alpha/beta hydrolase [Undibacter mobilis]RDV01098.1 alpha/beta hydrolase [Undibacter mobilis]